MPVRHLRVLLLAACLAVLPALSRAAPTAPETALCTAAGCVNGYWGSGQIAGGFGLTAYRLGQTFTPKFTGVLNAVHLGLETITGSNINTIAEIRPTANGVPTSMVLAEAVVPGAPYVGGVLYSADFSSADLLLETGTRYAVTLRSTTHCYALAAFPKCPVSTGANNFVESNDNGQTWDALYDDRSLIFEVCMDAVTPVRAHSWGSVKAIYR